MTDTPPHRVRLGTFEVDLRAGELRNGNADVLLLPDQPLQLLRMLVEADGEIVTREQIEKNLWPDDTVVEFDSGINTAVKKLRRAFGDSHNEPRYIETISKRGYRLMVAVERAGFGEDGSSALGESESSQDADSSDGSPKKKWLVVAAVLFVFAIVAGVVYLRVHAAPKLTSKDTIVLAEFANSTGDSVFDGTLKQALSIQLEQSPFLNVLSEDRIADTLKLMNRPANERITREIAKEVCLRTNGKALLAGTIATVGDRYLIGLKAVNCQTGDTLASAEAEADSRNRVLQALSQVGTQLREKLGESLPSVHKFNQPLEEATTPSLEALQAYTQGMKIQEEKGVDAGLPYFERAIQLDPNFAIAYAALGLAQKELFENSLKIRNITRAYALRDRASQRERYSIESSYYLEVTVNCKKRYRCTPTGLKIIPMTSFRAFNLRIFTSRWDSTRRPTAKPDSRLNYRPLSTVTSSSSDPRLHWVGCRRPKLH
jgi:DNA-binding winged helix-turn-helix (wHTH) protein